jgi:hypothetical protein
VVFEVIVECGEDIMGDLVELSVGKCLVDLLSQRSMLNRVGECIAIDVLSLIVIGDLICCNTELVNVCGGLSCIRRCLIC